MRAPPVPLPGLAKPALLYPPSRSWWRLAAMYTRAFANEPSMKAMCPWPGEARAALWLTAMGMLAAGMAVTTPSYEALAFLGRSCRPWASTLRCSVVAAGAGMVFVLALLVTSSWLGPHTIL